jgi:hypothetical protein
MSLRVPSKRPDPDLLSVSHEERPPLWSSGQSSWLQIRRPGFDSLHYQEKKKQWVWNGVHSASWVQLRSYLIESSGSCLENREYGGRDSSRWPRGTLYPQKLATTSPTSGGRSVGIVRSRTQTTEFVLVCLFFSRWTVLRGSSYWVNKLMEFIKLDLLLRFWVGFAEATLSFLHFLEVGWDWAQFAHRPLFGLLHQPRIVADDECGAIGGTIGKGNRRTRRNLPSTTLSTTNPTWPDLGLKRRLATQPYRTIQWLCMATYRVVTSLLVFCKMW